MIDGDSRYRQQLRSEGKDFVMKPDAQKLPVLEKIGYSLGDAGANFVFQTMILFQLNFYTDTVGIAAAIAGSLLLVGRLWDAFFDPMMGVISDRTKTRWGKFRPWVLWSALPWGIVMVLAYTTPSYQMTGKIIYACLTNILLMTLYSINNTPYSALTGVMTGNVHERTSLSSYRFVSAMIAQLMVGGFTLPLVAKFGQGNDAKGWQMTMGLWAVLCVVLFVITFLSTKERIQPDPKQELSAKQDFGNLAKNGPWIAMFIVTLAHFIVAAMRGGTVLYYFEYYLNQDRLFDMLQSLGLTSIAVGAGDGGMWHSLLNTFGLIVDAEKKECRLRRIQPVQHVQPVCDGHRRAVRNVSFDPIRQESRRADRVCADRAIHGLVHIPARGRNRRDFRPGILPRAVLRSHHPAALGHVCRCRGLRGMENGTPHYRRDLCNHHVRA